MPCSTSCQYIYRISILRSYFDALRYYPMFFCSVERSSSSFVCEDFFLSCTNLGKNLYPPVLAPDNTTFPDVIHVLDPKRSQNGGPAGLTWIRTHASSRYISTLWN